jgi:hypothetical protein
LAQDFDRLVRNTCALTNTRVVALEGYGLTIAEQVPGPYGGNHPSGSRRLERRQRLRARPGQYRDVRPQRPRPLADSRTAEIHADGPLSAALDFLLAVTADAGQLLSC